MNIYVLLKTTFHTEEKIVLENGQIKDQDVEFIINPYDEYAVEEAILQRDAHGGKVIVVSVGNEDSEKQIRTALAMGADEAVLIEDEEVENGDASTTARILAAYLKDKEPSLILAGNMAIDGGSGQVGPFVAELLGIQAVTTITKIDIANSQATIVRDVEGNHEIVEVPLPVLVTCQQGLNEPRYPSLPGIMKAKKKSLETLDLDDLDLDDLHGVTETKEIFLPKAKSAGVILEGETAQQVQELIHILRTQVKVI